MSLVEEVLFGNGKRWSFQISPPSPPLSPRSYRGDRPATRSRQGFAPEHGWVSRWAIDSSQQQGNSYGYLAKQALRHICEYSHLPKMMRWLAQASPYFYKQLREILAAEICQLWDGRAPLEQFQRALDRWVTAHNDARLFYESQAGRSVASKRERAGAAEHNHSNECLHRPRDLR